MDYLDWLRWPSGPVCPGCGRAATVAVVSGRVWRCSACTKRVSRTAGTIFQDTRTPLTVWFAAGWYMTADPGGVSALTMKKLLGLGSYQTAWAMLHRYRTAMVRPGRELLSGRVEVDETVLGGEQPGPRGRGALGKTLVVIAVELLEPKGYGRTRMSVIPDAAATSLRPFLLNTVEPGATVVTDGWSAYPGACQGWFAHEPHPVAGSGSQAHELLPAVHRVASLCKRWLLGTHQGGMQPEHMQAYLDEFCFRFNRRHARGPTGRWWPTHSPRPPNPTASSARDHNLEHSRCRHRSGPGARPPNSTERTRCETTCLAVKWIAHLTI